MNIHKTRIASPFNTGAYFIESRYKIVFSEEFQALNRRFQEKLSCGVWHPPSILIF